jgi:hypothetical protein
MKIEKNETEIVGRWIFTGRKVIADEQCERIQWLTTNYLKKLGLDKTGWDVLFQDPNDSRCWELIYPNSEMHGGGPPSLILLSESDVKEKYNI